MRYNSTEFSSSSENFDEIAKNSLADQLKLIPGYEEQDLNEIIVEVYPVLKKKLSDSGVFSTSNNPKFNVSQSQEGKDLLVFSLPYSSGGEAADDIHNALISRIPNQVYNVKTKEWSENREYISSRY